MTTRTVDNVRSNDMIGEYARTHLPVEWSELRTSRFFPSEIAP
jgi:hypothetical protein